MCLDASADYVSFSRPADNINATPSYKAMADVFHTDTSARCVPSSLRE